MRDVQRRAAFGTCTLILCLALFNVVSGFSRTVRIEPLDGQTRNPPRPPQSVRLYVLDGGTLESDPARYQLKRDEVSATPLSVTAFLIVHPKGTLMWDTGAIADDSWTPSGRPVQRRLVLSNGQERLVTLRTTMRAQLAAIGYTPSDITYLALSHFHWDHTANANQFVKSTWLARQAERDAMLPDKAADPPQPSTFADLKNGRTVLVATDDHDVFGDGTVVMKLAKGHTPGHQVLYVKLAKTGGVVLSGDLYHYPEERTLNRLPTFEFNVDQTRQSRAELDTFLKSTGAMLWIQHDLAAMAKTRKAPAYYE
jgi:glyoxylase-like metal-dependent hydrolase (beta-lactamase superfamily II)